METKTVSGSIEDTVFACMGDGTKSGKILQ